MASLADELVISPLASALPFGATVTGLTAAQLEQPGIRRQLNDLWIERGVLLFREGESSQAFHLALSRCFGALEAHPFPESRQEGFPDLVKIKFYPEDGSYYDVGGELRGGWLPWHSDLIYTHRINRGGILRPVQLPASGGETGFIDQIAAYDTLPAALQQRIDGLSVVYSYQPDLTKAKFGERPDRLVQMSTLFRKGIEHPSVQVRAIHPLVYEQAGTGRKILHVSPWFADGIEGMENEEGDALLREVISYVMRPELMYFHQWQPGDMVLWDNWRMLHCACGVPPEEKRIMRRTTIVGDYGLGRREAVAA